VWTLLAAAMLARLPAVLVRFVIGTDEGLFLTLGRNLARGLGYTGNGTVVQVDFPPGFSLYAAAVYALGGEPELPSVLNVIVIGSLVVVPVYLLARRLFSERVGFYAGLFTALLPALALAQGNFESVAEPLYTLLMMAGWGAVGALAVARRNSVGGEADLTPRPSPLIVPNGEGGIALAFGAGLALGAAHLVRWEGVLLGVMGAAVLAAARRGRGVALAGALLAGLGLFAVPYGAWLHARTGSVISPKATITQLHGAALRANETDPFAFEKAYATYEAYLADPRARPEVPEAPAGERLAGYARNLWLEARLWVTSVSIMAPLWIIPAIVGAWRMPRRSALFLGVLFVPLAAIPASVVDPRYFLPALPALMIFAAYGWARLLEAAKIPKVVGTFASPKALGVWLLAGTLAAFALGDAAGPFLFPRPVEYRTAGLALRDALPEGAHVLARKRQVPFYAGAFWEWLPYGELDEVLAYAAEHEARYLVVDEATTPGLRPQLAFLLDPAAAPPGLRPVYVGEGGPRVVVYELEARE
jgi:4-amino-4-deoxy-L-arabinose transferase-like glycosyltransferase